MIARESAFQHTFLRHKPGVPSKGYFASPARQRRCFDTRSIKCEAISSLHCNRAGDRQALWSREPVGKRTSKVMAAQKEANRYQRTPSPLQILSWAPNIVGYARLGLLFLGLNLAHYGPRTACCLLLLSFALDGVDGALARRLGQVSEFGAFLDVAIDILSRGTVLAAAGWGPWAAAVLMLEATTFVCTHAVASGSWKDTYFQGAPTWAKAVMANGFKTPLGCLAMAGLFGLPLWAFARHALPGSVCSSPLLGALVVVGRLVCLSVETWVVSSYLGRLLERDCQQVRNSG